jgi:solute carrier family 35, member F1/2
MTGLTAELRGDTIITNDSSKPSRSDPSKSNEKDEENGSSEYVGQNKAKASSSGSCSSSSHSGSCHRTASSCESNANFHPVPTSTISIPHSCLSQALYHLRHNWKILLAGQCLSLLLATAGAAQATLHLDCGLSAPTFTMMMIYFGLSLNIFVLLRRNCRTLGRREVKDGVEMLPQPVEMLTIDLTVNTAATGERNDKIVVDQPAYDKLSATASSTQDLNSHSHPPRTYIYCGWLILHRPLWWYMAIAFLDVQANAVTMLAFRYTTLTSITLLDALAIPSAMMVSKFFLQRKYQWMHVVGVVVCMVGVVANIMTDYESKADENDVETKEYPHKLRGDLCAVAGGILYGLNDVLTEITVSYTDDNTEYMAMMGLFAFVISTVQSLLLEWDDILEFFGKDTNFSSTCSLEMGWWLLFTFVGASVLSYTGASRFLMVSEAAFYNLSLLTGDLWSVIFSIVEERITPRPLFFLALVFVLSGVLLYELAPSPASEKTTSATTTGSLSIAEVLGNSHANYAVLLREDQREDQRSSSSSLIDDDDDDEEEGEEDDTGIEMS